MVLFSLLFTFYPSIHQNIQKRIYEVWGGGFVEQIECNDYYIFYILYYYIFISEL